MSFIDQLVSFVVYVSKPSHLPAKYENEIISVVFSN